MQGDRDYTVFLANRLDPSVAHWQGDAHGHLERRKWAITKPPKADR